MKKLFTQDDYIKANRKASREAEIEMYGHPICHKRVHKSKRAYDRKKIKAADKKLPYFFAFFSSFIPSAPIGKTVAALISIRRPATVRPMPALHNPRQLPCRRIDDESVDFHI